MSATTVRSTQSTHPMSGRAIQSLVTVPASDTTIAIFSAGRGTTYSDKEMSSTETEDSMFDSLDVFVGDSPGADTSGPVTLGTPVGQYHEMEHRQLITHVT